MEKSNGTYLIKHFRDTYIQGFTYLKVETIHMDN